MSISAPPPKNFRVSIKDPNSSPGVRTRDVGDEGNPLSSLRFEPAWDSDELYDALRIAYPRIKSHKDRFLRAVIEFYDAELGRARTPGRGLDTPPSSPPENNSVLETRERSSSSEDWKSSEGHSSIEGNSMNLPKQVKPKGDGMESMQAIFSIVPGGTRPRTKRPMTDEERKQYRHTKRVGACEPCRKRKRKCICKLKEETQLLDAKRARISVHDSSCLEIRASADQTTLPSIDNGMVSSRDVQSSVLDVAILDAAASQAVDNAMDMSVSRAKSSFSLSPSSLALDSKFDFSNFSLCPELNLGDLALPDVPGFNAGLHEIPFIPSPTAKPDSSLLQRDSSPLPQVPDYLNQCEAFINFLAEDDIPTSLSQNAITSRSQPRPVGYPDADFTASIILISRATTALAPFSRLATDAQLLLSDLRTLKLQLKLLRKPLPFLSESVTYFNTFRDFALDIREPLQEFLTRLEKRCGVEDLDGQRLGLAYTSTAFQLRKLEWVRSVKDDAKRLRGMIGSRSTIISSLMTLASMETLTEVHNLLNPNGSSGLGMRAGIIDDFDFSVQ